MAWTKYNPPNAPKGITVPGDPNAPATKWYNHWLLALTGWKMKALFTVQTSKPFRVGFRDMSGNQMLNTKVLSGAHPIKRSLKATRTWPAFRMKIGREPCTFFAVDLDGNEVSITHIRSGTDDFHLEQYDDDQCPLL